MGSFCEGRARQEVMWGMRGVTYGILFPNTDHMDVVGSAPATSPSVTLDPEGKITSGAVTRAARDIT